MHGGEWALCRAAAPVHPLPVRLLPFTSLAGYVVSVPTVTARYECYPECTNT